MIYILFVIAVFINGNFAIIGSVLKYYNFYRLPITAIVFLHQNSKMMKKLTLTVLCLFLASLTFSQSYKGSPETEKEVNLSVWKPFKESYESRDWQTFNDLHTDDVMRISTWSGIRTGEEYKEANKKNAMRKDAPARIIDFWLEHRIYGEGVGYEVGYYRISQNTPDGETRSSYARFHIVLRKVNGHWKIAQDWDINQINGEPVTAEDFAKGEPLSF